MNINETVSYYFITLTFLIGCTKKPLYGDGGPIQNRRASSSLADARATYYRFREELAKEKEGGVIHMPYALFRCANDGQTVKIETRDWGYFPSDISGAPRDASLDEN